MSRISTHWPAFLSCVDRQVSAAGVKPRRPSDLWRALVFGERYIVSRALLHFERIERPSGPLDKRMRTAIALAAETRAPFARPGLSVVWGARHAQSWSWDKDRLSRLGVPPNAWVVAESALDTYPVPDDGHRMRQTRDGGHEVQVFHRHELFASRFWPHHPSEGELELFLRRCRRHDEEGENAKPTSLAMARLRNRIRDWSARITPMQALLGALVLLGAPLLHQTGAHARLSHDWRDAQAKLETVIEESATRFQARRTWQDSLNRLDSYRTALDLIHPLAPAADLAEAAQTAGGRLQRFQISQNAVRAELTAEDSMDPAYIVGLLENAPSLSGVTISRVQRQQDTWEIRASLNPRPSATEGSR